METIQKRSGEKKNRGKPPRRGGKRGENSLRISQSSASDKSKPKKISRRPKGGNEPQLLRKGKQGKKYYDRRDTVRKIKRRSKRPCHSPGRPGPQRSVQASLPQKKEEKNRWT